MLMNLLDEVSKFFTTFGLIIILFTVLGTILGVELRGTGLTFLEAFIDLFLALNGKQEFALFTYPFGKIYIGSFMYMFKILFLSLLSSMIINRYRIQYQNIDA